MQRPDIDRIERAVDLAKMHTPDQQAQYLSRNMVINLIDWIEDREKRIEGLEGEVIVGHKKYDDMERSKMRCCSDCGNSCYITDNAYKCYFCLIVLCDDGCAREHFFMHKQELQDTPMPTDSLEQPLPYSHRPTRTSNSSETEALPDDDSQRRQITPEVG